MRFRCRRQTGPLALSFAFLVWGCSFDLLREVDLPTQVTVADLSDPALAETLVLGVQGDFECGLVDHIWYPGIWFGEFLNSSTHPLNAVMELRDPSVDEAAGSCNATGPSWTTLQLPRVQAGLAIELINGFPEGTAADKDYLLARAFLYEGYSIQLLGEAFCGVTFDGGPMMTREAAWDSAVVRFTSAIEHGAAITGPNAAAAAQVVAAAYVGRARAKLNLGGDASSVVADASMVPDGFEFVATYDESPGRRRNRIYVQNNENGELMPHADYLNLTVSAAGRLTVGDGIADPRVMVEALPGELGQRGILSLRHQRKYQGRDAPIPFATWREAQLMIAEVEKGQTAVDIINRLRADWNLPVFASDEPTEIEATIREERRRELWMQGHHIGDKLRWGTPFERTSEYGEELGPGGPLPIPFIEVSANAHLASSCP